MVKLRLRRRGRKFYDPMTTPSTIVINEERALYWLRVGAQPTDIVRHLLSTQGILLRLHLERKGVPAEEIEQAVARHREKVAQRVQRILEKKQKKYQKSKPQAAPAAENEAASAEPQEG